MKKAVMIFLIAIAGIAAGGNDKNSACTCYTQNVVAEKGASFSVGVYLKNGDTLAGMQIPIYYRSRQVILRCDSVTFLDSRCSGFSLKDQKIDPKDRTAYFVVVSTRGEVLTPGDGLVATLWFTTDNATGSGRVELFSGPDAFIHDEKIEYRYLFWTPSAQQVDCRYQAGFITIK